jgi:hypothetical protein
MLFGKIKAYILKQQYLTCNFAINNLNKVINICEPQNAFMYVLKPQNNKKVIKTFCFPCFHKCVYFSRPQSRLNESFVLYLHVCMPLPKVLGHVIHFQITPWVSFIDAHVRPTSILSCVVAYWHTFENACPKLKGLQVGPFILHISNNFMS